jgi:hypothetical protein
MGGFGSGRYRHSSTPSCDDAHSIDLAWLRRRGMLKPGPHSLVWSWRGNPTGSISIVAQADGVRFLYWVTGPKGERMRIDEFVPFRYTPTRFGGQRQWFTCLRCHRRCRRLFGGRYFRCRQCHGLEYASRNMSPAQRAMHRADRIANRLHDMWKGTTKRPDNLVVRRLGELGWIEGQTIAFECVSVFGRIDQVQALARELVSRRPDVLMTASLLFVSALKQETTMIPIVMLATSEPLRHGLITSFARPGGNITGVAWFALIPKEMELLKEIVPNLRRVAWIVGVPGITSYPPETSKISEEDRQIAASALGFTWQIFRAAAASDYDEIFARLAAEHFDAAYIPTTPFNTNNAYLSAGAAPSDPSRYRTSGVGKAGASAHLWPRLFLERVTRVGVRRQDTAWCQAKRPSRRAGGQASADNKPQNCQGAWPHRPAFTHRPRRRGDRIGHLQRWVGSGRTRAPSHRRQHCTARAAVRCVPSRRPEFGVWTAVIAAKFVNEAP